MPTASASAPAASRALGLAWRLALLVGLLYIFLVAIHLMSRAFALLGGGAIAGEGGGLLGGVANPFAALAVGVLAPVLVQSSSTTSSVIVSSVGAGLISVRHAVPMVMGANIGTTVTNTLVSVGHVRRSEEFRRAFAAATVHDFFNLLCVAVFLPLELATGVLARSALAITEALRGSGGVRYESPIKSAVKGGGEVVEAALDALGLAGAPLAVALLVVGVGATLACLVRITRTMRTVIAGRLERAMNRALGRSGLVGILVGIGITVLMQSSSVTTSLLVPMCAAGVLPLTHAFPIMLGANVGTTLTALLASLAVDRPEGLTIALVHLLFNLGGIALFYPVPALRRLPPRLAELLAAAALRNRLWVAAYVLGVFVLLPLLGWRLFA